MIYLDYHATTPVDSRVADRLYHFMTIGILRSTPPMPKARGWWREAQIEGYRYAEASYDALRICNFHNCKVQLWYNKSSGKAHKRYGWLIQ